MPFLWFFFGTVLGGIVGSNLTARALRVPTAALLKKLQTLPEPARSQALAAIETISEEDMFNEFLSEYGQRLTPEEIAQLRSKYHPSHTPYLASPPVHPDAAAGALWTHHGYYLPQWPNRVYGGGYGR
jgi:hypothetical protein